MASPLLGTPAPAVEGRDILSRRPVGLDQYRGHWVLVNFLATWCTGCRDEQPQLRRLASDRQLTRGLDILAVLHQDSADEARTFTTDHGGRWPIIDHANGSIAQAYLVGDLPNSVLNAPDGTVETLLVSAIRAHDIHAIVNAHAASTIWSDM